MAGLEAKREAKKLAPAQYAIDKAAYEQTARMQTKRFAALKALCMMVNGLQESCEQLDAAVDKYASGALAGLLQSAAATDLVDGQ